MLIVVVLLAMLAVRTDSQPTSADPLYENTEAASGGLFDFETYDAATWRLTYRRTLNLAGYNRLFPERPAFALPQLETGGRAAGSGDLTDPYIPPRLLKAIAWVESNWSQADWSVPYGGIGPVKTSSSGAYGIMQVLSGMENTTGMPNLNQAMIGGHYAFNIARGAQILADKWNYAPEYRPIVGKRNPKIVENWYYAVWSYHGFAFRNHPRNPDYSSSRPEYRCDGTQSYNDYPYQELVFGCLKNPPVVDGKRLWDPLPVTLPSRSNSAFNLSNWEACSTNGNCAKMDISTPKVNHKDSAQTSYTRSDVIGSPGMIVSRGKIELSATHGDQSPPVSLSIANTGSGVLAVRVVSSESWLNVSRYQGVALGSDLGTRNLKLSVRATSASVPAGTHEATIKVQSLYPAKAITIKVVFRVFKLPDGTLLADSSNTYLMRGGRKHLIPNQVTFEANGFDRKAVVKVPDSLPSTISTGAPLLNSRADGNLLKGSAGAIYVMEGGRKRHVTSPTVMKACGYGWDAVRRVSKSALSTIPKGSPLSGSPCPHLSPSDGRLLTDSGPTVYVMQKGLKRAIPNSLTLRAEGYRWGDLNRIADSSLASIPTGDSILSALADGNLLKGSGGAVYVMEDGAKRHVTSPAVMDACEYGWDAVRKVPDARLSAIPKGTRLSGSPCPHLSPSNGRLVTDSGSTVYVMRRGLKRAIPNSVTLLVEGYQWGNVNRLANSSLASIQTGDSILSALADGNLLKGKRGAVYVMEDGAKRHVTSPSVMDACEYGWDAVRKVTDARLSAIPEGTRLSGSPCPYLSPSNGRLVTDSGSKVYVMRRGLKRHIPDPLTFKVEGFQWGNLNRLADSSLASIPTGDRILSALADGNLLKGKHGAVYVMEDGAKRHVTSPSVMDACEYGWDAVRKAPDSGLSAIPTGSRLSESPCPHLSPPDGALIQGSGEPVYVMDDDLKRLIADDEVLSGCSYHMGNVNSIADSSLEYIPVGDDLSGEPCP